MASNLDIPLQMNGRMLMIASAFALFLAIKSPAHAESRQSPWTSSKVNGTPEPPLPYATVPAFPKLKFRNPVELISQPGSDRLAVAEVDGKIFTFPDDPDVASPDLCIDLRKAIDGVNQIYGIAFHPEYPAKRELFICYIRHGNATDGTRVSRFQIAETDPLKIDVESEEILLTWRSGGHNGGCLRFGGDGCLYVSSGDASGPNPPDTFKTGQGLNDLLSCIMRIDIDRRDEGKPYHIPEDNPFVGREGAREEIWAYGFRNPWKMSFQPGTNELWVGDVGWDIWELVFYAKSGGNYGWSIVEGSQPINTDWERGREPIQKPLVEHAHSEARSITGGFVYRGKSLPDLVGAYVYGDYVTGKIWALRSEDGDVTWKAELTDTPLAIICFGEDRAGELFVVDYGGSIHRLVRNEDAAAPAGPFPQKLSETGIFADTARHKPSAGVEFYSINAGMWSDGATSERLFAVPGDSQLGTGGRWGFPEGSVIVKTLAMQMDRSNPASCRRVETQILHRYRGSWNAYTYAWNEDATDADLVGGSGEDIRLDIADAEAPGGKRTQRWHYASRAECGACHTRAAGFVLGCGNDQLNLGDQFQKFAQLGLIAEAPAHTSRTTNPHDRGAALDARARSYLNLNCAHCHRPDGGGLVPMRLADGGPVENMLAVGVTPMRGTFDIADAKVIAAGKPWASALYYRLATLGSGRMPHIGSHSVDRAALELMYEWIRQLPAEDPGEPPVPSLDSTSAALSALREIDHHRMAPADATKLIAESENHASTHVADLFRRFRPGGDEFASSEAILALGGDAETGKTLLLGARGAVCLACHLAGGKGRDFGPDLNRIGNLRDRAALLQSILEPASIVEPQFMTYQLVTKKGETIVGLITKRSGDEVAIKDVALNEHKYLSTETAEVKPIVGSLMPASLLRGWKPQEIADLIAYLKSLQ